jgi:hypothetical protein
MRLLALAVLVLAPVFAFSGDYPTNPEEQDKFCEAIGETPNVAVPPRDRLWLKENCVCERMGACGKAGSKRYARRVQVALDASIAENKARIAELKAEEERQRAAEEARRAAEAKRRDARKRHAALVAAVRTKTAQLRQAYWACTAEPSIDCNAPYDTLIAACNAKGVAKDDCIPLGDEDLAAYSNALAEAANRRAAKQREDERRGAAKDDCFVQARLFYGECYEARKGTDGVHGCEAEAAAKREKCMSEAN